MPAKNIIQLRKGTSVQWSDNSSVVLASGEPGFDLDKNLLNIGDGSTPWSGLIPVGSVLHHDLNINTYSITGVGNIDIDGDLSSNSGNFTALSINAGNGGFVFPTGDGNQGQVLKTDGNGNIAWAADNTATGGGSTLSIYHTGVQVGDSDIAILDFSDNFTILETPDTHINISLTGVLENVVEDTSPQLGANLDINTYSVTGIGGININNDVVASGELKIGGYQPSDLENPGYLSVGEVRIQQAAPPTYVSSYKLYDIVTDSTNHRVGINMHDGSVYSELAPENTLDVNGTFSCPTIVAQENGGWATDTGGYWFSSVKDLSVQLDPSVTNQQAGSPGLLIGEGAKNYATNSMVFATNYFTSKGDAQRVFHVIQYESTDASDHYLTTDKSGTSGNYKSAFSVALGTVLTFTLHIAANNDTDDTAAGWIIRGCIKNSTGTPQIVGSLITENFADASMSSASVSVVPNGTYDRMNIKVNGISGKTIRWVCSLDGVVSRF